MPAASASEASWRERSLTGREACVGTTCTGAARLSFIVCLFVSSLLGPHVVCGSPVAVFFSFSLFVDCVLV